METRPNDRMAADPAPAPGAADPQCAIHGEAPEFALPYLMEYTPEAMIAEIRRVGALVQHPVLSIGRFNRLARVHATTVIDHLGSWKTALQRAGLAHRFSGSKGALRDRQSDRLLLAAIRAIARKRSAAVLTTGMLEQEGVPRGLLCVRFGSVARAVKRAGFAHHNPTRRRTLEELHDNLLAVWRHYGRAPSLREIGLPPSLVGGGPYLREYRTWKRALTAFVKGMHAHPEGRRVLDEATGTALAVPWPGPRARPKAKRGRKIDLALRYRVLKRDRFRCTACGASPAEDPACKLHVDHIAPFSRGGKTELANLRTLCARCNIGKGARAEAPPASAGAGELTPGGKPATVS
jgi:hypothetical protein